MGIKDNVEITSEKIYTKEEGKERIQIQENIYGRAQRKMEKVTSQTTHCGGNKLIMSSVILLQSPDHAPELSLPSDSWSDRLTTHLNSQEHICRCNHWSPLVGSKCHSCSHGVGRVKSEDTAWPPWEQSHRTSL